MIYTPIKPKKLGYTTIREIDLKEIAGFIDWKFFFHAWKLSGKYDDIATACDCISCRVSWLQKFDINERDKAEEAVKLYKDALERLNEIIDKKQFICNASIYLGKVKSEDESIVFTDENVIIPALRQQHPSTDGFCYSLSDFLSEESDYSGAFVTTIIGAEELAEKFEKEDDVYQSILVKTLADRLAEAAAEWLHYKVRKDFWGYAPDENISVEDMLKTKYQGIRPAIGYPSLPDQSIIFDLNKILKFNEIGVKLTENGAMYPNASVCGIYFAHPQSKYFMVGKIDQPQLEEYSRKRGKTAEEMKKWLGANI